VNAHSIEVRRTLLSVIRTIEDDPKIQSAIIIGAGKSFIVPVYREINRAPIRLAHLPFWRAAPLCVPQPIQ
jgi:hypothetical protein